MRPEELESVIAEEATRVDVDEAWTRLRPRVRAGRRKGRLMVVLPLVTGLALGGGLIAWASSDGDGGEMVTAGSAETSKPDDDVSSTTAQPSSTTSSTTAIPPPPVPFEATFGSFIDRADRTGDGRITLPVVSPGGHTVQFTMTEDVAALLSPLRISWHAYIVCRGERACGSAEVSVSTWPEAVVASERLISTLRSSDGREVLLVESGTLAGRVLRWVLPGGSLSASVSGIPESAYDSWVDGLQPTVDDHGWLTANPSTQFAPDGERWSALFFAGGPHAGPIDDLQIVQSPGCTVDDGGENPLSRPDGAPNLVLSQCVPEAGVVITVVGDPAAVRVIQSGLAVA